MSGRHTKSKTSFPVTPIPGNRALSQTQSNNCLAHLPLCTDVSRREDRGNQDLIHRTSGPPDSCRQRLEDIAVHCKEITDKTVLIYQLLK